MSRDVRDTVATVVSVFNPDDDVVANVRALLEQTPHVVVVDDGSTRPRPDLLESLSACGAAIIRLEANSGIASALNHGIKHARTLWDDSWIMTMDQDSRLGSSYVDLALSALVHHPSSANVAMICAETHNGRPLPTMLGPSGAEVFDPMQSGTLFNAAVFDDIGYFDEDLFIDCVDTEFTARVRCSGRVTALAPGCDLEHSLGRSWRLTFLGRPVSLLGRPIYVYEHAPFRVYYITRNSITVARRYFRRVPSWVARRLFMEVQSLVLRFCFGANKLANLNATIRGFIDGWRGKLGPINGNYQRKLDRIVGSSPQRRTT